MKLGTRIFCCNLLVFTLCLYYPVDWFLDTLRTRYLEGVEDPLADQANILAELAGQEMADGGLDRQRWQAWFDRVYNRQLQARIYALDKDRVDLRVYVTDGGGRILFDSLGREELGTDFSQWRDVQLTLEGRYGARTTKADEGDESSSILHVAAPIISQGRLAGVLTVAKPTGNIWYFIEQARPRILGTALLALVGAGILSYLSALWLTSPIRRLTAYALAIRDGRRPPFPRLDRSEIGDMGAAFRQMQEALEGKRYVEQYIQTLTHEMKSPLSAIRGAAELLAEPMTEDLRQRFLGNIRDESLRMQQIIDRMLELASLEARATPHRVEPVAVEALVRTVAESLSPQLMEKHLHLELSLPENFTIAGDAFLLHRALSNLLQNAIEFSPDNGRIELRVTTAAGQATFTVTDQGPGIPAFALDKVFDKFYSLERPASGRKSTGLGLNFVSQVALLHGGTAALGNRPEGGACATLAIRDRHDQPDAVPRRDSARPRP